MMNQDMRIAELERERDRFAREARLRHEITVAMIRYFVQGHRNSSLSVDSSSTDTVSSHAALYGADSLEKILSYPLIEPDFSIFSYFDNPSETVLDLGANTGLAAASIYRSGARAAVLSFEPNPRHRRVLSLMRDRMPGRFDFKQVGLGSSRSTLRFYTPVIEGQPLDTLTTAAPEASLDWAIPENLLIHCMDLLPDITSPRIQFCEEEWHVDTLDAVLQAGGFGVTVDRIAALKVDVEGHEAEALRGALGTIEAHRPLVMVEGANRDKSVDQFLRSLGYIYADYVDGRLELTDARSTRVNGFYLHQSRLEAYGAKSLLAPLD
jgi:FkbM family methyltransferase